MASAPHSAEVINIQTESSKEQEKPNIQNLKIDIDESLASSSSVARYRQEWLLLLKDLKNNAEQTIRDRAFASELKVSKFRSIYWAILLRVLNIDYKSWRTQREQQRRRYERLKQEFSKNPHETETPDDNPLSQSTKSIWNQYFSDQELFAVIRQDVVRTFPGVDFFRKTLIQNAMCNVLFYYAREHPYMCYRQGMHEILAPILFVIYSDHQSLLHFMEIANSSVDAVLLDVLSPDFFEADAYSIFARLMSSIEAYYRVSNLEPTPSGNFYKSQLSLVSTEIEVIGQLNSIRDKILAKEDLHLHNYLLKLDIPLHIFGIRWLRLLFGREFPLLDLLILWDAIFADSDAFNLPNYILVAMLIRIRNKLLLSDYTSCLTYLMRYPAKTDVNLILQHALHMHMPKKFERPLNAFEYFLSQPDINAKSSKGALKLKESEKIQQQRNRSISLNGTTSQIEQQISVLQTFNAADAAAEARLSQTTDVDNVIDGYSSNSPELLRLELKNAQTIISIARNKLQTYLAVIRKHANNSKMKSEELTHAMDSIEELCSLLDIKYMFPLHARRAPIDQAFEANESKAAIETGGEKLKSNNKKSSTKSKNSIIKQQSNDQILNLNPEQLNTSTNLETSSERVYTDGYSAYEKPDDCVNATRLLGGLKEIELIPITSDEKIISPIDLKNK